LGTSLAAALLPQEPLALVLFAWPTQVPRRPAMEVFARRRLRRDWVEVLKEPSSLVAAAPLPDNLFEWHANLRPNAGPLAGVTFHLRITFPADYPNSPPFLHFPREEIPSFRHPNLYSFGLCLDILSSYIGESRTGWSPAYTVRTLLMQLQSFLFEFDSLPQDHGGTYSFRYDAARIQKVRQEAHCLKCRACGHSSRQPHPALPDEAAATTGAQQRGCNAAARLGAAAAHGPQLQVSFEAIEQLKRQLAEGEAELLQLPQQAEAVRREVDEAGAPVLHAGEVPRHLSAASRRLSLRIRALSPKGRLYLGLATSACRGLTDKAARGGCVAWGSQGGLILGSVVHKGALPHLQEGDEIEVSWSDDGTLCFALNGEVVAHRAPRIWPVRPLAFFLFHPATPQVRGCDGPVRDACVMISFQDCSLEVLGDDAPSLQDERAVWAEERRAKVQRQVQEQHAHLKLMMEQMTEGTHRVLKARAGGAHRGLWASELPREVLFSALSGLEAEDVPALLRVCSGWRQLVERRGLLERLQICCFYTKVSPWQDTLGFGVSAEYHADGNLKALSTELDVLSLTAFSKFNLRRGVWGEDFEFFLPMVLDGAHAQRSLPLLEQSLVALALGPSKGARPFEPWMALAVLPQLMNSFVVSLMNAKDGVTRHASEKALLGYCSFHHMLLALASRHPCIPQVAEEKLHGFACSESGRHKSKVPDLGQLLVYITLSESYEWHDLAPAVIRECSTRSILWLLREHPKLESPSTSDAVLVRESFQSRLTGLRLLMFQAFFLRTVASSGGKGPKAVLAHYNQQFGLPSAGQKEALFRAAREILQVSSWPAYYRHLGRPCPRGPSEQAGLLRQAMEESACKGYHTPSARGWDQQARKAAGQAGPRRTPPVGRQAERVGMKLDLQRAFRHAAAQVAPKSVTARAAEAARVPLSAKAKEVVVKLQNAFHALDDSEGED